MTPTPIRTEPFRFGSSPVPRVPVEVVNYLLSLPVEVRQGLGNLLLDSTVEGFDGTPETSARLWEDELRRRCDDARDHPERLLTAVEVHARLAEHMEALARVPRPPHTDGYHCQDYFSDGWAERGFYDPAAHLHVVFPLSAASDETREGFMAVGDAGADGVRFGYRFGYRGVWAFYPSGREFRPVAGTVAELVERWRAGTLEL